MKTSSILIAVFTATMTAAPMAKAAEIDFDGGNTGSIRSVNFAISNAEINQAIPEIPAPAMEIQKTQRKDIDSMSGAELENLNTRLDLSIKTAVDYCTRNRLDVLKNNLADLLANGTIKEKYGFVNNSANKYVFQHNKTPGAAILEASAGQQKGGIPVCMSWGTQKICVKRETKEKICTAATLSCVAATAGGAPVCTTIAAVCAFYVVWVDECNDVPYCTNWYTEVM